MGPRRILLAYLLLGGIAVPWYWQFLPIADTALVMGMPVWAFGAVLGSLAVSLLTSWLLLRRWPCEMSGDGSDEAKDQAS